MGPREQRVRSQQRWVFREGAAIQDRRTSVVTDNCRATKEGHRGLPLQGRRGLPIGAVRTEVSQTEQRRRRGSVFPAPGARLLGKHFHEAGLC